MKSTMSIVGEKARAQLAKGEAEHVQNVIVDLSKIPLTFATASLVTDTILAEGAQKHQIVYNRFQSVISFKPTVATVFSSDEYEKAAEAGSIKFDEYEMEGPERSEFLLDLAEFNMGVVMYNALLENSTSELGSRMQSRWRIPGLLLLAAWAVLMVRVEERWTLPRARCAGTIRIPCRTAWTGPRRPPQRALRPHPLLQRPRLR